MTGSVLGGRSVALMVAQLSARILSKVHPSSPAWHSCCSSTMKAAHSLLLLLLLGLLTLLAEMPPSMGQAEKPGSCPKLPPGRITICTLYCRYDWQCPRREKCCTYGCTAVCKDPMRLGEALEAVLGRNLTSECFTASPMVRPSRIETTLPT
ncbi:hypothetical protein E2320_022996 [Naja naja]|nr:hypothetical protein E2320_022996 [Naja naja]